MTMMLPWLDAFSIGWRDIVDILLVTVLLYRIIVLVQGTHAVAAIYGLALIVVFYIVTRPMGFNTLTWILESFLGSLMLVVIIVFQRDIRMALTYVGSQQQFLFFGKKRDSSAMIEEIAAAAGYLAQRNIGAIIVVERNVPLGDMTKGGVPVGAQVTKELLSAIFWHGNPLHDGAVIIRRNAINAAGAILPLSTLVQGKQDYGTRHRAALGVTEETDAIAVVVSEERGVVTVAIRGKLSASLDGARLRRVLTNAMEESR